MAKLLLKPVDIRRPNGKEYHEEDWTYTAVIQRLETASGLAVDRAMIGDSP